jgi:hypothetical protein
MRLGKPRNVGFGGPDVRNIVDPNQPTRGRNFHELQPFEALTIGMCVSLGKYEGLDTLVLLHTQMLCNGRNVIVRHLHGVS